MKIERITFISDLEDIENIYDSNINISIQLENGLNYVVVIGTPKNLLSLMENEKSD